jgi:LemA protein
MKKNLIAIGIASLFILIVFMSFSGTYNDMISREENVNQSWSQVQNVYQRRLDLIPNLVNTVQGYANFEKSTLTDVINARAKATSITIDASKLTKENIQSFQEAQTGLSSALSKLMVVSERYPELKANQNFMELMSQLEGTENRITVERSKFNNNVTDYNKYIRTFPNNFIASMCDFEKKAYFEADKEANKAPAVKFN